MASESTPKGFTLLELLVVIAIIGILATLVFISFNATEALKKGRDAQRFSDLNALHTSMALYSTMFPEVVLCDPAVLYVSIPSDGTDFSSCAPPVRIPAFSSWGQVAKSALRGVDGTGWIPINLDAIVGKSPIGALPLDPLNRSGACPDSGAGTADAYYRFGCFVNEGTWEIDTRLESERYKTTDDRDGTDGGNYPERYEIGRNMKILPADE